MDEELRRLLTKPGPSLDTVDEGRHRLQKAMHGPSLRRRGWLAGGVSVAAAAAAVVIVVTSGGTARVATPTSPPPAAVSVRLTARQILLAAAGSAAKMPAGKGAFWYVKLVSIDPVGSAPDVEERWTRLSDGQAFVSGAKSGYKPTDIGTPGPFWVNEVQLTYRQIMGLPTNSSALKAWFAADVKRSGIRTSGGPLTAAEQTESVFNSMISLVTTMPAPPKVRAAAFRVIASSPKVKSLGPVAGGQGLEFPVQGLEARMVIDPATSRVHSSNYITYGAGELMTPDPGSAITITTAWTNTLPR